MPGEGGLPVCVFCRRQPQQDPWRPFCSERCKLQDLARWASGSYRIAAEDADDAEGDDEQGANEEEDST
jgi:endogenous inhibitor of DNA gyrase (YacG/DUF329 family)